MAAYIYKVNWPLHLKAAIVQSWVSFPFALSLLSIDLILLSIDLIHDFGPTLLQWKMAEKDLRIFVANINIFCVYDALNL